MVEGLDQDSVAVDGVIRATGKKRKRLKVKLVHIQNRQTNVRKDFHHKVANYSCIDRNTPKRTQRQHLMP